MMNSPVMQALARARLNELAQFMFLPAGEIAQALSYVGADPLKLQAAANLMLADGEPVALPRSWRKDDAPLWAALPPSIQRIIADREFNRDREIRKKQDEAAKLRHENERLKALLAPAPEAPNNNGAQEKENEKTS
jgi:hypothetical protein